MVAAHSYKISDNLPDYTASHHRTLILIVKAVGTPNVNIQVANVCTAPVMNMKRAVHCSWLI
jgi:hypothetical protein